MRAKLRDIAQASGADPKGALFDAVAHALPGYEIFHNRVLVATYIRPEKTKGGVFLADRTLDEDRFQGKVGLVLKVGPRAFVDDAVNKFDGIKVEVGDWVTYRASDGRERFLSDETGRAGVPCRLLDDNHIEGRISDPDLIY